MVIGQVLVIVQKLVEQGLKQELDQKLLNQNMVNLLVVQQQKLILKIALQIADVPQLIYVIDHLLKGCTRIHIIIVDLQMINQ